ncbi:MAG TPA: hypothetical protein VFE27_12140, partial [Acidobacteriaceae bacterium]|nr:hypothetical protein [Acidobacteriaceae bacterium]
LEKALQFIKGGFCYRAKREIHFAFEIWQASFVNHRVRDAEDYKHVHLGESGQSGLERETGAVCVVIGVSGDGIGRPATRAKALNLYIGPFSRA